MEALDHDGEGLAPSVIQVIEQDLSDPRRANMRRILTYLAQRNGLPTKAAELRHLVEGDAVNVSRKVLNQLVRMTEMHGEKYGFEVECIEQSKKPEGNTFLFTLLRREASDRKRSLSSVSPKPEEIPVTSDMARRVSGLIGGLPLLAFPPEAAEVSCLINNAHCLRRENPTELAFIEALIERARRGMAVRVETLHEALDIPAQNPRLTHNLRDTTVELAPELGFTIDVVRAGYQAIFFLEPEGREAHLITKYATAPDERNTFLDRVVPFDPTLFEKLLTKVPIAEISKKERKVLRIVVEHQANPPLLAIKELLELTGVTENAYQQLIKKCKTQRYEWGFYIRSRGDKLLECVLIDKEALKD